MPDSLKKQKSQRTLGVLTRYTVGHMTDGFELPEDDTPVLLDAENGYVSTPASKSEPKATGQTKGFVSSRPTPVKKSQSKDVAETGKRKRGRPVGAIHKTEEMRVEEQRRWQKNVQTVFKDLRLDELTNDIRYTNPVTGKEETLGDKALALIGTICTIDHGLYVPDGSGRLIAMKLANQNSYNPIHKFLSDAKKKRISKEAKNLWANLDQVVLGRKDQQALKVLQSILVAAVARTFDPGCAVPVMPIIEGRQGCGKSNFIRSLVPRAWHAELNSLPNQLLQDPSRMHVGWLIEIPECDRCFKPSHIEDLKTMITTQADETRRAYAELPVKLQRKFVMVGTTNSREFLVDSENRRFPILAVKEGHLIDTAPIEEHQLELWALAVQAYEGGFQWIPSQEEIRQMAQTQLAYQSRDPWAPLIFRHIVHKDAVSAQSILESVLEITKKDMKVSDSKRVGKILLQFGWERQSPRKIDGVSVRLYRPGPRWNPDSIDL